jgi:hypothetical protein
VGQAELTHLLVICLLAKDVPVVFGVVDDFLVLQTISSRRRSVHGAEKQQPHSVNAQITLPSNAPSDVQSSCLCMQGFGKP